MNWETGRIDYAKLCFEVSKLPEVQKCAGRHWRQHFGEEDPESDYTGQISVRQWLDHCVKSEAKGNLPVYEDNKKLRLNRDSRGNLLPGDDRSFYTSEGKYWVYKEDFEAFCERFESENLASSSGPTDPHCQGKELPDYAVLESVCNVAIHYVVLRAWLDLRQTRQNLNGREIYNAIKAEYTMWKDPGKDTTDALKYDTDSIIEEISDQTIYWRPISNHECIPPTSFTIKTLNTLLRKFKNWPESAG